jgi:drug/metabolite transporter (DMT)-like permease
MNNKDIILIGALFIIFGVLIFTTPYLDGRISLDIWIFFIILIFAAIIVRIMMALGKKSKNEIIDNFTNQNQIIQILGITFFISVVYELITGHDLKITLYLLGFIIIVTFLEWFFEKE